MTKTMRRLFSRAALVLLMMLTTTTARAQVNTELTEGDWRYKYDETNAATLISYIGTSTNVTTPTTIAGHPVVSIGDCCFRDARNTLESVVISSGVSSIGRNAFESCRKMTSITIPSSVNTISKEAFLFCSGLTSIALPSGLSEIEEYMFKGCSGLTSISIPHGVVSIGNHAFDECTNLASVTIPNSVTTICNSAFYGCTSLESIIIPTSVTNIDAYVFTYSGMTDVYYAGTKSQWDNNVTVYVASFLINVNVYATIHYQCTVTFDVQGHGSAPAAQTEYTGETVTQPTAPTATGYEFGGWYTDAACTSAYNFATEIPVNTESMTLYAKWTALANTITFDLGGKGSAISNQTVYSGNTVTEPDVQFDSTDGIEGWYTDAGRTAAYDFTTAVDHSFTLYAKWASAGTATITANAGGTATLTNAKGQTFADGKVMPGEYTLTVTPESGYSFSGSYTLTDRSSGTSYSSTTIVGSATKTYVLDLTEKDAAISITFDTTPKLSITATTDGTATAGTWTLVDGFSNSYDNGSTVTVPSGGVATSADNITLTVTKGETVGCAMTIVNNGTKEQVTSDVTSYSFAPAGGVDIELFFYDKTDGMMTLLNDDGAQPDGDKNADRLSAASGQKRMVTLSGRTLYRDGDWNTLCLPFDFDIEGSALDKTGVTLMELDTETAYSGHKTGYDEGTLYLNFKSAGTTIEAGKPYIIKWTKPSKYDQNPGNYDIASPVFGGVTVSNDAPSAVTSEDGKVTFVGNYSPIDIAGEDRSILFLGAANTLYYPNDAMTINSCRAHFELNGITAGDASAGVRAFVLNFDGDGEATGITDPTPDPSPAWEGSGCAWYSLDGRRLSGKPTTSGIYINNGRKVAIK